MRLAANVTQSSTARPQHIVLFGDSIFDNAAYTRGEPSVIEHLRRDLPPGWQATLCAVDGATTRSIGAQLQRAPADATRAVVAVGGNDALANMDLLSLRVTSSGQALSTFAARLDAFEPSYRRALDEVGRLDLPTTVCTIYNGALPADEAHLARVGLMMFNDTICRVASERGVDIIELRAVCTDAADYANPIEPSGTGGQKIARAIAQACGARPISPEPSRLWSSALTRRTSGK